MGVRQARLADPPDPLRTCYLQPQEQSCPQVVQGQLGPHGQVPVVLMVLSEVRQSPFRRAPSVFSGIPGPPRQSCLRACVEAGRFGSRVQFQSAASSGGSGVKAPCQFQRTVSASIATTMPQPAMTRASQAPAFGVEDVGPVWVTAPVVCPGVSSRRWTPVSERCPRPTHCPACCPACSGLCPGRWSGCRCGGCWWRASSRAARLNTTVARPSSRPAAEWASGSALPTCRLGGAAVRGAAGRAGCRGRSPLRLVSTRSQCATGEGGG